MTFRWENHQIKSYEYGFMAQKLVGKQWKSIGYYTDLKHAVGDLFEHRLLTETVDCVVDARNEAQIVLQSTQILKKIEAIAADIRRGLDYDTQDIEHQSRDLSRV